MKTTSGCAKSWVKPSLKEPLRSRSPRFRCTSRSWSAGYMSRSTVPSQGKVDMVKWYSWLTFDIIGDLTFGSSFKCLDTRANHSWVNMVFGSFEAVVFMGACHRFTISRILLPYLIPKRYKEMIEDHWKATEETLARRIELGTNRRDYMSPVLENNIDGQGLN